MKAKKGGELKPVSRPPTISFVSQDYHDPKRVAVVELNEQDARELAKELADAIARTWPTT